MGRRRRDDQRSKVYAAESDAEKRAGPFDNLESMEACGTYVTRVLGCRWYEAHGGWKRIGLEDGRGCRRAGYLPGRRAVSLPRWARTAPTVVHEVAHALTHRTHPTVPAHGGVFCRHMIELARECIGPDYADALEASLAERGARVMSIEHLHGSALATKGAGSARAARRVPGP